jgi:fructose-1-phosphate kinase PfkB-like protein
MVKCNLDELRGLTDGEQPDGGRAAARHAVPIPEVATAMLALRARGVELVVVTLGPEGVLLADGAGVIHASVPRVEVVNATGSGDLLLAGLAVGIERDLAPREALILGAACGTAGVTHLLPELPADFDAASWTARIQVREVAAA